MINSGTLQDLHLDNAADALTEISSYLKSAKLGRSRDTADVTTYGMTDKAFQALLKTGTIPLEGNWDPTIDAIMSAAYNSAATKSFRADPAGPGVGNISYTGECWCTAYDINPPVDGVTTFSATLQISGPVTRTVL